MNNLRNLALWILIALLLVLLFNLFQNSGQKAATPPLTYTQFSQKLSAGEVKNMTIQLDQVKGDLSNGTAFTSVIPQNDQNLWNTLKDHPGTNVTVAKPDEGMPALLSVLVNWFPMLLMIEGTSSSEGRARNLTSFFCSRSTRVLSCGSA